jgi:hypothetical protein
VIVPGLAALALLAAGSAFAFAPAPISRTAPVIEHQTSSLDQPHGQYSEAPAHIILIGDKVGR